MFGGVGGGCPLYLLPFSLSYIQDDIAKSIIIIINMKILKQQISKKVQITHPFKVFAQKPSKTESCAHI